MSDSLIPQFVFNYSGLVRKCCMSKNLIFNIADISIAIEGKILETDINVPPAYRPFLSTGETDISLRLKHGLPDFKFQERIFDCPPIWTLYRCNGRAVIRVFASLAGLERILVLQPGLEEADLYFAENSNRFLDPFHGPIMELIMVNYLGQGRGVIVHGCAIAREAKGMLFVGESGAGKSTLATMWDKEGVEVLSDDRTVVRKREDDYWIYGTPWHGEGRYSSPRAVRLERIFFLRHGREHSLKCVKGIDSVSRLLTCSFPPYWNRQGMEFSMELFTDLPPKVPCEELTFKPEISVLDFIKSMVKK